MDDGTSPLDDLLQPTIDGAARSGPPPWNRGSQIYVAVFGGPIAVTAIAFLNARRLALPKARQWWIVAVGAIALLAMLVYAGATVTDVTEIGAEGSRNVRLVGRGGAVVAFLVFLRLQRDADRRFRIRGGEYASLWGPGIAAVVAGSIVQAILVYAVTAAA